MSHNISENNIPLCVDLDGTLISTDSLAESILLSIKNFPFIIFLIPFWLIKGKNFFKNKLSEYSIPDFSVIPYNEEVVDYIREQKKLGRKVILATASVQKVADEVYKNTELFDEVYGSSKDYNLRSSNKRKFLVEKFGEKQFDYIGDSTVDINVWDSARKSLLVNPSKSLITKVKIFDNIEKVFNKEQSPIKLFFKEIRVYQWIKNILIFFPLLMAHKFDVPSLFIDALLGFISFSFTASFVYVTNDLLDLESDRHHPRKRTRPFASGNLSFIPTFFISLLLFITGISISIFLLPSYFTLILFSYIILTSSYSLFLKRIFIIDIILLSILYTIRLIAGAFVVDVPASPWLLEFSVFLFLSLAIVKRYTELLTLQNENKTKTKGRGYYVNDIGLLRNLGTITGYISVLVFVLYLHSNEVMNLYNRPYLLWIVAICLLFWITRIWFLAHRGKMHDDPIVFTGKDKTSYILGLIILILVIGAAL